MSPIFTEWHSDAIFYEKTADVFLHQILNNPSQIFFSISRMNWLTTTIFELCLTLEFIFERKIGDDLLKIFRRGHDLFFCGPSMVHDDYFAMNFGYFKGAMNWTLLSEISWWNRTWIWIICSMAARTGLCLCLFSNCWTIAFVYKNDRSIWVWSGRVKRWWKVAWRGTVHEYRPRLFPNFDPPLSHFVNFDDPPLKTSFNFAEPPSPSFSGRYWSF